MKIIISGTPGTGKSMVAAKVGELTETRVISITDFAKKSKLGKEIDIRSLKKLLLKELKKKKTYVVEGHLACEFKIPADFVFVLRTHPTILKKRLLPRGYGIKKLEENLFAEMLDYCTQRTETEYGKPPLEIDTTRLTANGTARKIVSAIKKRKEILDRVDYSGEIKKYLKLKK